jgi:hypothetical protein
MKIFKEDFEDSYFIHGQICLGCGKSLETAQEIMKLLMEQYTVSNDKWGFRITQDKIYQRINEEPFNNFDCDDYVIHADMMQYFNSYEELESKYNECIKKYCKLDLKYRPYFHIQQRFSYANLDAQRRLELKEKQGYDIENTPTCCLLMSNSDGEDL